MLFVDLPAGGRHGWGVVGDNLASALAQITPTHRFRDEPIDGTPAVAGPLLQSVTRPHLRPRRSYRGYTRHVGYAVFEHDIVARRAAPAARDTFDVLVAASKWAEQTLREGGLANVTTIHHGVDGTRFHAHRPARPSDSDEFVVFSGGKLELRKGQDVAVEAFRVLSQRHEDVRLVAAWHNPWVKQASTMAGSPYHPFIDTQEGTSTQALERWLSDAGLDLDRVTLVPPLENAALADVYAASDVGLFPNRCEGSTNLVLMEYMACGRSAVATDFSGHLDVLTSSNSRRLRAWSLKPIVLDGGIVACWCEPSLEETIEQLEQAYQDREGTKLLGQQAGLDLARWTWSKAAREFVDLAYPNGAPRRATDDMADGVHDANGVI